MDNLDILKIASKKLKKPVAKYQKSSSTALNTPKSKTQEGLIRLKKNPKSQEALKETLSDFF